MPWPTASVNTSNLDNTSDDPSQARSDILDLTTKFNELISTRGTANGVASLNADSKIPIVQLPKSAVGNTFVSHQDAPLLSADQLNIPSVLAASTWGTFGPIGSNQDFEWTALDLVDTEADWIELRIFLEMNSTSDTANIDRRAFLLNRPYNSTAHHFNTMIIGRVVARTDNSGNAASSAVVSHKVPASSGKIELFWGSEFSVPIPIMFMSVVGFGFN